MAARPRSVGIRTALTPSSFYCNDRMAHPARFVAGRPKVEENGVHFGRRASYPEWQHSSAEAKVKPRTISHRSQRHRSAKRPNNSSGDIRSLFCGSRHRPRSRSTQRGIPDGRSYTVCSYPSNYTNIPQASGYFKIAIRRIAVHRHKNRGGSGDKLPATPKYGQESLNRCKNWVHEPPTPSAKFQAS